MNYLFGDYPDLFQDLCLLFIDDNLDSDGDQIFTNEELMVQPGYPEGESFFNGHMIHEISEALDLFFIGSVAECVDRWKIMLNVFENKGFSEIKKNILKQMFLNMIGFLDGLYIEEELNGYQTDDE